MSNSKKIQEDLSAYLDGELSPGRAGQVEKALADDPKLSAELDDIRAVRSLLAAMPHARAPRDMVDSVLQQAERASLVALQPSDAARRPMRWMRYAAVAALLVVATSLGVMLFSDIWPDDIRSEPFDELARAEPERLSDQTGRDPRSGVLYIGKDSDETVLTGPNGDQIGSGRITIAGDTFGVDDGGIALRTGGGREVDIARGARVGKLLADTAGDYSYGGRDKYGRAGGIVRLGSLPEGELNEVIYTPAVAATQRRVEIFLADNSIRPITTTGTVDAARQTARPILGRGNYYRREHVTAQQVRIRIDAATPEQIERIRQEIDRIRMDQRVSQMAIPGEAIALHRSDRPNGRRYEKPAPRPATKPRAPTRGGEEAGTKNAGDGVATPGRSGPGKPRANGAMAKPGMGARGREPAGPRKVRPDAKSLDSAGVAQAPPKKGPGDDTGGRRTKAKGSPGETRTAPSQGDPRRGVTGRKTDIAHSASAVRVQEGQLQTLKEFLESEDPAKGEKILALLQDDVSAVRDGWMDKLLSRYRKAEAASRPTSRSSKAATREARDRDKRFAQLAWQLRQPTSRTAGLVGQQLIRANIRSLVITLNFRAITDLPAAAKQIDASQREQVKSSPDKPGSD